MRLWVGQTQVPAVGEPRNDRIFSHQRLETDYSILPIYLFKKSKAFRTNATQYPKMDGLNSKAGWDETSNNHHVFNTLKLAGEASKLEVPNMACTKIPYLVG